MLIGVWILQPLTGPHIQALNVSQRLLTAALLHHLHCNDTHLPLTLHPKQRCRMAEGRNESRGGGGGGGGCGRRVLFWGAAAAAAVAGGVQVAFWRRVDLPAHLLHHPLEYHEDLLDAGTAAELMALAKDMADFPTVVNDLQFYRTRAEHVGEAQPIGADGRCAHPFLVPSVNKTACVLPGRVDVGRAYVAAGGVEGLKEAYPTLVSRVQSFSRYMFNISEYPLATRLFSAPSFQAAATAVCPPHARVLDPFQFNLISQAPGQTVATHIDAPYFWGFDRFDAPQWLLAVMVFSGLFQDAFVPQVQVVAYFHTWRDDAGARGGSFVYWDDNNPLPKSVQPHPRSGSAVDGSKTVHAATVFMPHVAPPLLDKSRRHVLHYEGHNKWVLLSDGVPAAHYTDGDLRFSIVYRARCFASEEVRAAYHAIPEADRMTVPGVLAKLRADLVARGRLAADANLPPLDFALLLMNEYVKYPLPPNAWLPLNYCALPLQYPAIGKVYAALGICQG